MHSQPSDRGQQVGPEHFHDVLLAYCGSKSLMSAVELDLFTTLGDGTMTEPELREELSLHPRFAGHFLQVLVELGLLEEAKDGFRNTPMTKIYLDREKATYIGGFAETTSDTFYPAWGKLTKALRTGQAQAPIPPDDEQHLFRANVNTEADRIRRFMSAMDTHSTKMGKVLSELIDWSNYSSVADIGGCRGNLVAQLVKAHENLNAICFDRPQSEPFFNEHMKALRTSGKVTFRSGDFFADALPKTDVLILGHVLHDWSPANREILMQRAYKAVSEGGIVIVYDRMIDGSPKDLARLFYSLTFMLASGGGSEYSVTECTNWMLAAGFGEVKSYSVMTDHTVVIGHR